MLTNVAELLTTAAAREPGKSALCEAASGRRVTWAELDELVDRVVHGFGVAGMVGGYRVVIALTNRIEFVAAYFGALRAGLVVVPVNPRAATGELVRVMADCGARMVLADDDTVTTVRAAAAGVAEVSDPGVRPRVVTVGTTLAPGERSWDQLVAARSRPVPLAPDPEALAVLLYTGGASGPPRAAMLSHRALLANIEQVAAVRPPMVQGTDVVLGVLPLFQVYGLNAVLGGVVRQQARLVLVDGFDAEECLDIVEDEAVSVLPAAPVVFAQWMRLPAVEDRFGPVRLVVSGDAPLDPDLTAAFTTRTGVSVQQGYGLTEAAPVVTSTLCSTDPHPTSVGAPLPGVGLRLRDEQGREPEGEDGGEIWLRGDNLFSGYWPDGTGAPGPDGWWASGDVGYLDERGDLVLVDRVRDLVVVSGFPVYPSEVEEVLLEVEGVLETAVVGVPDSETGEAVVAYVRVAAWVASGADSGDERAAIADAVRAYAAHRLARFKQPTVVRVVDALPHTVTGKVQKGRLREAEQQRTVGSGELT